MVFKPFAGCNLTGCGAVYELFPTAVGITTLVVILLVGWAFWSIAIPLRAVYSIALTLALVYACAIWVYQVHACLA